MFCLPTTDHKIKNTNSIKILVAILVALQKDNRGKGVINKSILYENA